MTSRDFCYWLQGFYEINGVGPMTADQSALVARHLAMVFVHEIDPSFGADNKALDAIHNTPAAKTKKPKGPKGKLPKLPYGPGMRC